MSQDSRLSNAGSKRATAETLFWAEWVSLAIIATHFILDSVSWSSYRALQPDEAPKLMS
jgi:hypothetical protein